VIDVDQITAPQLRWDRIIALAVLAVAYAVLFFRPRGKREKSNGEKCTAEDAEDAEGTRKDQPGG
jgi:mannose/fructose/N-acetylgalactosamine-specific phosphotransferase system component IIC